MFLNILQNSQENVCPGASLRGMEWVSLKWLVSLGFSLQFFLLSSFFILMFKISLYFALFRTNGKNYKFLLFLRILELRDFRTFDPRQILHSRQISDPRQTTPSFRLAPKIYWATPKFYKTYTTHTTRTIFWPLPTTYHALTLTT